MDVALVLDSLVLITCATDMVVMWRQRQWLAPAFFVRVALLIAAAIAYFHQGTPEHPTPNLEYAVSAVWGYVALLPRLLDFFAGRLRLLEWFHAAMAVAWIRMVLIPYPAGSTMFRNVRAQYFLDRGWIDRAIAEAQRAPQPPIDKGMIPILYRFNNPNLWTDMLAYLNGLGGEPAFSDRPLVVYNYIRALGETGDLEGLVGAYARLRGMALTRTRQGGQLARLVFLAFTGRAAWVRRLLDGPLRVLPRMQRQFWTATAELAAGDEQGRRDLELLAAEALSPPQRAVVSRRLDHPPVRADQVIKPLHAGFIREVEQEIRDEERFVTGPSDRRVWVTYALVIANAIMFYFEFRLGGLLSDEALDHALNTLGAVSPNSLKAGEYWRVLAANFLHAGWLHISMNMLGLLILGPFVERTLGALGFFVMYMVSGLGSVFIVTRFMTADPTETLVGASAAIMGIVGAMAAIYLRAKVKHRAVTANYRLRWIGAIVVGQFCFDKLIPGISDSAHMVGCAIGFIVASLLPYNNPPTPGTCVQCGYDLRATPDRCPECGSIN